MNLSNNDFFTILLTKSHDKKSFCCGKDLLDGYLKRQARQDVDRMLSACFVLLDTDEKTIKGYYTLSNSSIDSDLIPDDVKKKLPKSYTSLPTSLLGRLAVDQKYQSEGLGKILLIDALKRCFLISERALGSFAVIVDPLDNQAQQFYEKYGFILLPDSGKMFLAMKTIKDLFNE